MENRDGLYDEEITIDFLFVLLYNRTEGITMIFSDVYYFSKRFKQETGLSPTEYKKI